MLGTSETVGGFTDLFDPADKAAKIYSKLEITGRRGLGVSGTGSRSGEVQA